MGTSVSYEAQQVIQAPPEGPPERPAAPRRRWLFWTALGLVAVLVLAVALALARRTRQAATIVPAARTLYAPASRGKLVRSVRVSGVLAAVHFASVSAPSVRGPAGGGGPQLTLVRFAPSGSRVRQGEVLAEFERQAWVNTFEDRQADFISLTDQIAKRRAELGIEKEKQLSDLQKARADLDAARLENRRNEVISKIDAEKNQQALAEAEATLKMLQQTFQMRQAAAEAELKLLEIRRQRQRLQMDHARSNFERFIIRSPIAGLVVLTPIWKNRGMGLVQEGEQIRPGQVFLQVVDPSSMVVRTRVNQLDAALLKAGGPAEVRLDAYPDLRLPGHVESVSTLALSSDWSRYVKLFPVVFAVEGSDPRLVPDLSASVDVKLEEVEGALLVPRGAVAREAESAENGIVWVKQGDRMEARAVTLGPKNDTHWAIRAGLKEGEMVALVHPAAPKGQDSKGNHATRVPG